MEPAYLFHDPEHLVATPIWRAPIIIILFYPPNANCAVAAAAPAQEPSTWDMALTAIQPRVWRGEDVPICLSLVVHCPPVQC